MILANPDDVLVPTVPVAAEHLDLSLFSPVAAIHQNPYSHDAKITVSFTREIKRMSFSRMVVRVTPNKNPTSPPSTSRSRVEFEAARDG